MKKKIDLFTVINFLACMLFYVFFAFLDGAVICVDSPSYINMQSSREPLYPILLALARCIFKGGQEGDYLAAVAFSKHFDGGFRVCIRGIFTEKIECFQDSFRACNVDTAGGIPSLPFCRQTGIYVFQQYFNRRHSHSSLFTFFRFLIEYIASNTQKSLCWCLALSFLMISTRKQMLFAFVLLLFAIIYVAGRKKKAGYGIATVLLSIILVFGANMIFDVGYNYMVRGSGPRTPVISGLLQRWLFIPQTERMPYS